MSDVMTEAEFAAKVDSEGGFFEAIFGYGLSYKDVEPGFIRNLLFDYEGYITTVRSVARKYYDYEEEEL